MGRGFGTTTPKHSSPGRKKSGFHRGGFVLPPSLNFREASLSLGSSKERRAVKRDTERLFVLAFAALVFLGLLTLIGLGLRGRGCLNAAGSVALMSVSEDAAGLQAAALGKSMGWAQALAGPASRAPALSQFPTEVRTTGAPPPLAPPKPPRARWFQQHEELGHAMLRSKLASSSSSAVPSDAFVFALVSDDDRDSALRRTRWGAVLKFGWLRLKEGGSGGAELGWIAEAPVRSRINVAGRGMELSDLIYVPQGDDGVGSAGMLLASDDHTGIIYELAPWIDFGGATAKRKKMKSGGQRDAMEGGQGAALAAADDDDDRSRPSTNVPDDFTPPREEQAPARRSLFASSSTAASEGERTGYAPRLRGTAKKMAARAAATDAHDKKKGSTAMTTKTTLKEEKNGEERSTRSRSPAEDLSLHVAAFARAILSGGDSDSVAPFKAEWAVHKDRLVIVGSHGRDQIDARDLSVVHRRHNWVKTVDPYHGFAVTGSHDWSRRFAALREASGMKLLVHETCLWSAARREWIFLPRRASPRPFAAETVEQTGSDLMLVADESFGTEKKERERQSMGGREKGGITIRHVGVARGFDGSGRGFSAARFLPGSGDRIIVAIRTEEHSDSDAATARASAEDDGEAAEAAAVTGANRYRSFILVFDLEGLIIMPETEIFSNLPAGNAKGATTSGHKFEGLAFLGG